MIDRNIGGFQFIAGAWPLDAKKHTVVFIHGAANTRMFWKAQVAGISTAANTLALDLPGHGMSAGPGADSVGRYAALVDEFIGAVAAPGPVLCGLSLGGAVALRMLLDRRREYAGGVIINSGARLRVLPAIFDLIRNDFGAFCDSMVKFGASPQTDPSLLADALGETRKCDHDVAFGDFTACNAFDVMDRLHEISVPVMVVTAADDLLSPPKYGRFLAERIPGARLVEVPCAGHMSPVEKPDEINGAIIEFIRTIAVR